MTTAIVWFRRDLRLSDHPALQEAVSLGGKVVPLFIWAPEEEGEWAPGGASRWWLHHSLENLRLSLKGKGASLTIRRGGSLETLLSVAKETGATHVFWNRLYEPRVIERDKQIKESLTAAGLQVRSFNGALLREPWEVKNQSEKPFQVFTPFWKAVLKEFHVEDSLPEPAALSSPELKSLELSELQLLPTIPWDRGMREEWSPGESAAKESLRRFLKSHVGDYSSARDIPSVRGTSRLSPHLHFGEISPRQIWNETNLALRAKGGNVTAAGVEHFLREIGWREFAHHLLFHFSHTPNEPLRENFKSFPWVQDAAMLRAWAKGLTGYPIVDAGMRELWTTGWMHNRVRMIVSSFLVKHLRISWLEGAKWFWDTLVDASLASNTLGWQWSGGCGADAAPYFRIFNPITQGEKFDPDGEYVRKWVPELSALPNSYLFKPWEASAAVLRDAGIVLGETYPEPIVDHTEARMEALRAFDAVKK